MHVTQAGLVKIQRCSRGVELCNIGSVKLNRFIQRLKISMFGWKMNTCDLTWHPQILKSSNVLVFLNTVNSGKITFLRIAVMICCLETFSVALKYALDLNWFLSRNIVNVFTVCSFLRTDILTYTFCTSFLH